MLTRSNLIIFLIAGVVVLALGFISQARSLIVGGVLIIAIGIAARSYHGGLGGDIPRRRV